MAQLSVFHGLVSKETAYTQLLCNLLKVDSVFRADVLPLFFPGCLANHIKPEHIRSEVRLPDKNGQPDILIENDEMTGILELKLWAALQKSQMSEERGYRTYLRGRPTAKRWLSYLVPLRYEFQIDLSPTLEVRCIHWEDLRSYCKQNAPRSDLIRHFAALLDEKFGPISFTNEEITLFEGEFPYAEAVKLAWLVEGVAGELKHKMSLERKSKIKPERGKDDLGHYCCFSENEFLYFGCFPAFATQTKSPFCFGVEDKWNDATPGLFDLFLELCPDASRAVSGWTLVPVAGEYLTAPEAEKIIASRIMKVFETLVARLGGS